MEEYFETIKQCWETAVYNKDGLEGKYRAEKCCKQAILSLIGLWNASEQYAWKKTRSTYQSDAGKNVKLRRDLGDGAFEFTSSVELASLFSMAPIGRIALDVEQMRISQALVEIRRHKELTEVGAHVDGVYCLATTDNLADLKQTMESRYLFTDGSRVFQIKDEPAFKVPTYEQNVEPRSQDWRFQAPVWTFFKETDLEDTVKDLARLFLQHGGLYLSGAAGVGKTFTIHALLEALQEHCHKDKQLITALRHCAAMLVGGKTLQH